jgi:hypothetical protein
MNKIEEIFAKHFTEGVRKKAISQLRPIRQQGSHKTTFFTGNLLYWYEPLTGIERVGRSYQVQLLGN